ncbi:putative PIF1 helicase-like protein [Leptomonas seymouri]|uniref:ATP-dependent DNA helicase n=1 Tax=Leptomonas seymouri TaxID=5684 RepID=A0A0N1PA89_LEPSE|nr:putative PIF1 helicase-like protein [Leptomonas seymouri]|eukprot:KPI83833.1 putative PIF1 helicase-like protein [Leptomonas seymouri]
MLCAHAFSLLDCIARVLRAPLRKKASSQRVSDAELPFGGLQLLVVGDFLQLPPVPRGAGEELRPALTCAAWKMCRMKCVVFTKDCRHAADAAFAQCCADVRRGVCTPLGARFGVEATTVMARRKDVDQYNAQRLQQLSSPALQRYTSEDYAAVPGTAVDSEVSLPAVLTLKEGAQVVLLASLPGTTQLVHGDVGVVIGFVSQAHGPALPLVRFTTGVEAVVPAVAMEVYGHDGRLTLSRRQVPLQLAWALTVHRVQGLTLPMVRVALDASLFEAGRAYVALSRVRRAEDLCLTAFDVAAVARVSSEARDLYDRLPPSSDEATPASPSPTTTVGTSGVRWEGSPRENSSPVAAVARDAGSRRRPRSGSLDDQQNSFGTAK